MTYPVHTALAPLSLFAFSMLSGCAPTPATRHGSLSSLSVAGSADAAFCPHKVPQAACTRCNPSLVAQFKTVGDWCGEHAVPESQCFTCHPDLTFDPLPEPPRGADVKRLAQAGEDIGPLAEHATAGKVMLFDFYADWCMPCRKVDAHVYGLLGKSPDLAYRKLNLVSWDSALANRHMAQVANLPYVVVYGRDRQPVGAMMGLDLAALDKIIEAARAK
jgi:thiol-disulfide isomerase/thioredoxin